MRSSDETASFGLPRKELDADKPARREYSSEDMSWAIKLVLQGHDVAFIARTLSKKPSGRRGWNSLKYGRLYEERGATRAERVRPANSAERGRVCETAANDPGPASCNRSAALDRDGRPVATVGRGDRFERTAGVLRGPPGGHSPQRRAVRPRVARMGRARRNGPQPFAIRREVPAQRPVDPAQSR